LNWPAAPSLGEKDILSSSSRVAMPPKTTRRFMETLKFFRRAKPNLPGASGWADVSPIE